MFVEHGTVSPPLPELPRMYKGMKRGESSLDFTLAYRELLTIVDEMSGFLLGQVL